MTLFSSLQHRAAYPLMLLLALASTSCRYTNVQLAAKKPENNAAASPSHPAGAASVASCEQAPPLSHQPPSGLPLGGAERSVSEKDRMRKVQNPQKQGSKVTQPTQEPSAISYNEKYLPLMAYVENYCSFLKATPTILSDHCDTVDHAAQEILKEIKESSYGSADWVHRVSQKLICKKIDVDSYLNSLLKYRRKGISQCEKSIQEGSAVPCLESLFTLSISNNESGAKNTALCIHRIQRQQSELLCALIQGTLRMCRKEEIGKETKHLLRTATQLHSFLEDKKETAPHNDNSTTYALVQELMGEEKIKELALLIEGKCNKKAQDYFVRNITSSLCKEHKMCFAKLQQNGLIVPVQLIRLLVWLFSNNDKGMRSLRPEVCQKVVNVKNNLEAYIIAREEDPDKIPEVPFKGLGATGKIRAYPRPNWGIPDSIFEQDPELEKQEADEKVRSTTPKPAAEKKQEADEKVRSAPKPAAEEEKDAKPAVAARYGLVRREIAKDGNCLFGAVADQLQERFNILCPPEHDYHSVLRRTAVDYVSRKKEVYAKKFPTRNSSGDVEFSDVDAWLKEMSQDRVWGDEITIHALCSALQLTVVLIQKGQAPQIYSPTASSRGTIYLEYEDGIHYTSLHDDGSNHAAPSAAALAAQIRKTLKGKPFCPEERAQIEALIDATVKNFDKSLWDEMAARNAGKSPASTAVSEVQTPVEEDTQDDVDEFTDKFMAQWVLPTGLRRYHQGVLSRGYKTPLKEISNNHQKTVDALFDSARMCSVTFGKIKGVLEALGLRVTSRGSHHKFYRPDGRAIEIGLFAHGDGQTYGSGYYKYPQALMLYMGLRPTE